MNNKIAIPRPHLRRSLSRSKKTAWIAGCMFRKAMGVSLGHEPFGLSTLIFTLRPFALETC